MKFSILRVVLLLALCSTALRGWAQTTAVDSLTERRMVQRMSSSLCTSLTAENRKKPINTMSQEAAKELFTRLFTQVATTDSELIAILEQHDTDASSYGEQLGRKVAFALMKNCPAGQILLLRLGNAETQQLDPITPTEANVLQPVATAMCTDLQPRLAELRAMTPERRQQLLVETFQKHLKAAATPIANQYGADIFMDTERMRQLGIKIGVLMAPACPDVIVLFGELARKK